ncbi:hypothetical protein B5E84_19950 [Lachnoclostridium sp. An14]|uniref:hypothetical protein n=1 Tax=Lachnoclostridium sp. An14 TaxID=1965562 RepID=UPI000B379332|nr:hypothetical protein [Lachnoclostridium sp. An14]OUQ10813.1 hypothetical protein B5E84_19950 [Lachnoclostridium sp. An14]
MRGYWEEVTIYAGRKTVRQVLLEETPGRANPEVRRKTVAKIIRGEKVLCKDYGSTAGDCQYDDLPVKKMIVRPDQIRIYV